MIKFIATDMDGTLLNSNHQLPEGFSNTLEKLKEQDITLSMCTGRSYFDAVSKVEEYKDDLMFICENGAVIYYKNECIFSNFLKSSTLKQLIEIGREVEDAYMVLSGKNGLYVEDDKAIESIQEVFPGQFPMTKVESLLNIKDDIFKINIFDTKNAEKNSYKHFKKYEIENISMAPSGAYWLDIMNSGVNKGIAIEKVQEKFNISYNETMVFGDYLNDLEMMKKAFYSYAMKNAHSEVKEIANFETNYTNHEGGVVKTIDEYIEEKLNPSI